MGCRLRVELLKSVECVHYYVYLLHFLRAPLAVHVRDPVIHPPGFERGRVVAKKFGEGGPGGGGRARARVCVCVIEGSVV